MSHIGSDFKRSHALWQCLFNQIEDKLLILVNIINQYITHESLIIRFTGAIRYIAFT